MSDNFSKKLKELRAEEGITQSDLAKQIYSSQRTVSNWENRGTEPDHNTLCKLADIFGVTVDYLLGRDD